MVWYENEMYRKIYIVWYDYVLFYIIVVGYGIMLSLVLFGRIGKSKKIKRSKRVGGSFLDLVLLKCR